MRISHGIGIVATLFLAGCGDTHPVSGKITYADGTPMPGGGQITFNPTDPATKVSARGIIQPDGTFKMGTHADTDGVPLGTYKVSIQPTPPKNPNRPPPDWPPLQKKYMNQDRSELQFTVKAGRNEYKVVVEK